MLGVVTIGRNEGERLKRCLQSLQAQPQQLPIVYVDSGSTDGSLEYARSIGVHTVELDMSIPFTGARARNAGFQYLLKLFPDLQYVQFIDGDCELIDGWLEAALPWFEQDKHIAIVCGRNHEKFPDVSRYNQLADMEWNTPVGEAEACGGIALMRATAITQVNGFTDSLICGEEPEMCIRLRRQGWKIRRIDADMSWHDSDMHRFGQWWKRMIREGWAKAEGYALYGHTEERYMVREYLSGWLWGILVPLIAILCAWPTHKLSLLLLLGYPYLIYRIYRYRLNYGDGAKLSRLYASFCTLSKFPQAIGQAKYWLTRWRRQTPQLIEYKTSVT